MLSDNVKGLCLEIGKPLSAGKVQTFEQFRKTGNVRYNVTGQDGPEFRIKGRYHGYSDVFVFKTYNRKKYVFYSVNHYTERDEKYKSEYLVPGPRIGRAYRDWMNANKVQFY